MGSYSLRFKLSAEKDLRKLPKDVLQRVYQAAEALADNPFPHQTSKLMGTDRLYRIRIGDYRIIYEVETQTGEITVHHIRHRREVYRNL